MAVPKHILDSKGSWKGESKLHRVWLPKDKQVQTSASFLHIDADRENKFAKIDYIWYYEGARHEGHMLVCGSNKAGTFEIAWSDSWHQNSGILYLKGKLEGNSIKTKGDWQAEGETWGWTIELVTKDNEFLVKMENITPQGEATWAVEGTYHRE